MRRQFIILLALFNFFTAINLHAAFPLNASYKINPPSAPTAPSLNPIRTTGTNSYVVSWSAVPTATIYILQQSKSPSFTNFQVVAKGNILSKSFANMPNGTYYYRVRAKNDIGSSHFSNVQSITVPQSISKNAFVEGYWESWNSNDSVTTIVGMSANVIDIAFGNFTSTGNHTYVVSGVEASDTTLTQLVNAAHSAGKKVKVSIGGATYPLSPQLQTTQDAVGMAQALGVYVQKFNLDGVDLDIEDYPGASLQIALIQNLRQVLGAQALISYTSKTPASTTAPYDTVIQGAYGYLSSISLMAYDAYPGYRYQDDVMALISKGVPAAKIVVGLMPGYDDTGVHTSVSDIQTTANFVLQDGLAGLMLWDLNRDHENLTGLGVDAASNAAWNILH